MGQQTLQTVVTISGQVDNTFGQIGGALIGLGSQIDMVSQKVIDFGKESVERYIAYDDLMREVKAVGEFSDAEIAALDKINSEIARTTVYSNQQAAEAEVIMGQYGMQIADIQAMLPSTLNLAMAGNIEISNSIDYLYSSLMSLGQGVDYADELTDQMAKTAAIGATDVDTLGDSLMRLGSGAQMFKGGSVEILSILSAMSQFGQDQRGAQAGTWLRNFMLSLAAPAGSVDDVVDAMEQLGVAQEEIEEYADSHNNGVAAAAVDSLAAAGLKIYDESGQLLPAIDIIKSLRDTVRGSGEYSEDLTELTGALSQAGGDIDSFMTLTEGMTDNAVYNIFSKIFGKRGITTALNLISITDEEWAQIVGDISNSDGFAQSMADTMQGGLGGEMRELEAAWSEFQTKIGETLAPTVENTAGWLHDIVTYLSSMDEGKLEALVSGLGTIAAAGPALLLAGGAFRLIGYLLTPAGAVGLGLTTLVAAANALQELAEADMASNFGDMELNTESLSAYVLSLGEDFKTSYTEVNAFADAVDAAVASYQTASSEFSSKLLTDMLTGTTLTDADITTLEGLGTQMYDAILDGIGSHYDEYAASVTETFGGLEGQDNDIWAQIMQVAELSFNDAIASAESLSQQLRDAMTSAFADGHLTRDEATNIQNIIKEQNELLAKETARQNYLNRQKTLRKAQTIGYDHVQDLVAEVTEQRDAELEELYGHHDADYYDTATYYDNAIANGWTLDDGTPITAADKEAALADLAKRQQQQLLDYDTDFDRYILDLWETTIGGSDLADAYGTLGDYADAYLSGQISKESASDIIGQLYGKSRYAGDTVFAWDNPVRQQLGEYMARIINSMGGYDGIQDKIDYYTSIGDTESAQHLARLYAMEGIATDFAWMNVTSDMPFGLGNGKVVGMEGVRSGGFGSVEDFADRLGIYAPGDAYSAETARKTVELFSGEKDGMDAMFSGIGQAMAENNMQMIDAAWSGMSRNAATEYTRMLEQIEQNYDIEKILAGENTALADDGSAARYDVAAYSLLYGNASQNPEDYRINAQVVPEIAPGAVQEAAGDQQIPAQVVPEGDSTGEVEIPVTTTGESEAASGALASAQSVMDAGLTANADVIGLYDSAVSERNSAQAYLTANPGSWTVRTRQTGGGGMLGGNRLSLFADGGRAVEPGIIGEAGPEWAIPEEHSDRTAELLNAAREASGFTWPELLARNGGLNANPSRTPTQLIYSPTIIANDATGVEEKLKEDKERLDRWYEEKMLHDEVEVYA